jgi:DNA-binding winged helix-turn-helix (wHTH) protein/Tol biopolymer transport system component
LLRRREKPKFGSGASPLRTMAIPPSDTAVSATPASTGTYSFGEFTLDVAARKLVRAGVPTALPSRAFDALVCLIERRDRLVQKNELIDAIWADVVVTDDSLTHAISVLRRALGDERGHPKYIETVPRRGYRFIGAVRTGAEAMQLHATSQPTVVPTVSPPGVATPPQPQLARVAWVAAVAAGLIAIVALAAVLVWPASLGDVGARSVWLSQPSPPDATIASGGVLAPDGRYLAFIARGDAAGGTALWVRSLQSSTLERIPGTEEASKPFWSPDSRRIGFFANGKLMTVGVTGQDLQTVASVDVVVAGGTWGPDDTILFALWPSGLYAVPASGDGLVEAVAKLDREARDIAFAWPQFLPDGQHFLYQIVSLDPARSGAYVGNLATRESYRLLAGSSAATFAAPRHVLYVENNLLMAAELDEERYELTGRASVVARDVSPPLLGADNVVSAAGELLAFQHGVREQALTWFDRAGQQVGTLPLPTVLFNPRISPDQSLLVATSAVTNNPGLWLAHLTRAEVARLEPDAIAPLWAPDGKRIAFTARDGFDLLVRSVDGAEPARLLLSDDTIKLLGDWSPSGTEFVYTRIDGKSSFDLWIAGADDGSARPLLATPANEMQARISPDGRWVAYASDESGALEVYVDRYPELGDKRQVSNGGGGQPQWRVDQRELFYLSADRAVTAVALDTSTGLSLGPPRALFRASMAGNPADARDLYAAAADGSKFLLDGPIEPATDRSITVIVDWAAGVAAAEPPVRRPQLSLLAR